MDQIRNVAVIGAGTMGTGIAIAALDAGCEVLLLEQDAQALQRGGQRIADHYAARVKAGKLDAADAAARELRLRQTIDWRELRDADVVIEAVFEDLLVKQSVFQKIDGVARAGAVLASNTSYLDLDEIARATHRPQDVIGLHFFSPAHVMKLVEVVRGAESSPQAVAAGVQLAQAMKKFPVVTGNAFGFIGNRIYAAYRRQCEFMLEEGAYPHEVDEALESWGFAMGPFKVGDMSGLDIAWRMRQARAALRQPSDRYVDIPDRLCELGRLGRKTGAGYYLYEAGNRDAKSVDAKSAKPTIDPQVHALIDEARRAKRLQPRFLSSDEIVQRALLAMVNEAALLVAEGVAAQVEDVDLVLLHGYGFPRLEGGPVVWARRRGRDALLADLAWLSRLSGPGFKPGNPDALL
jgi:3-hydroxyacyl-CoA dehydrogenase